MVIYLYRWKLNPEKINQFQKAWSFETEQLRERSGSLGSRLHKGNDDLWYGYPLILKSSQNNELFRPQNIVFLIVRYVQLI